HPHQDGVRRRRRDHRGGRRLSGDRRHRRRLGQGRHRVLILTTKGPPMRISRLALAAPLLAGSAAAAEHHRIVVLDFDGPRTLAETSRDAVVRVLGGEHDLVSPKKWTAVRAKVARKTRGPAWWSKASRQAGVDAV